MLPPPSYPHLVLTPSCSLRSPPSLFLPAPTLRMFCRELAMEISVVSLGSSQTLRLPVLSTLAARRFWMRRFTILAPERENYTRTDPCLGWREGDDEGREGVSVRRCVAGQRPRGVHALLFGATRHRAWDGCPGSRWWWLSVGHDDRRGACFVVCGEREESLLSSPRLPTLAPLHHHHPFPPFTSRHFYSTTTCY